MQFKQGSPVYTAEGQDVGRVDRVVLNPKTKEVTHIVVRKGFLFLEDKIVPLDLIESSTDERVSLRSGAGDLEKLLPFEETHFVSAEEIESGEKVVMPDMASPLYWYPPMGGWLGYTDSSFGYPPPYPMEITQNIPHDTVAVREGALVITADDKEAGTVERVFTDSNTDRATYILISSGLLFKEKKLVPITWLQTIKENELRLTVNAATLDGLREYQPE